jgi:hypothetical protein
MTLITLMSHVFVILLMMLDFLITGHSIKPLQIVSTMSFLCTYLIFTFMYYSFGGLTQKLDSKIYGFLDWEKPESALIVCCVVVLCAAFVHFLFVLISYARNLIIKKIGFAEPIVEKNDNVNLDRV